MSFNASTWGQGRLLTGLSPGSSLSGFTAVITKDNLPTSALDAGSLSCLNGGGDWRFSTDINGSTQLDCEIVTCVTNATASSTKFIAWVRFPTYASGTREVYAFWNKAGQSQPAANAAYGSEAVWQDFRNNYHFNSAGVLVDSTGNHNLTQFGSPTSVTGQVGDATYSGGNYSNRFEAVGDKGIQGNTARTVSLWSASIANTDRGIASWGTGGSSGERWTIRLDQGRFRTEVTGSYKFNNTDHSDGTFKRLSSVYDGTTFPAGLINRTNGVSETSYSSGSSQTINTGNANDLIVAASTTFSGGDSGSEYTDEFSIRAFAISADLDLSEYNNQNNPAAFWTGGTVFVPGGGGTTATGAITLPSLVFSGSATDSTSEITATGAITLPSLVFSGSATDSTSEITATGAITLPSLVFSGSATDSTSEIAASGAVVLPSLVFGGTAGDPEVTPDFSIIIDASTKTVQTTANSFTIRI
jgi:hypothetical protein